MSDKAKEQAQPSKPSGPRGSAIEARLAKKPAK